MAKQINNKNTEKNTEEAKKKRLANLKPPFKKGESPNPNGRPKGKLNYNTRVDMAIEVLALKYVEDMNKKNKGKKGYKPITIDDVDIEGDIFAQHLNKARNGDRYFVDSFLDRRYGKATQPIELSGKNGDPIEYKIKCEEARTRMQQFQDKWFKK